MFLACVRASSLRMSQPMVLFCRWTPVYVSQPGILKDEEDDLELAVMSIGFMLPNEDDAVIWRGPRKNGLIKQFLTDVEWGPLDFLIIDTPPGTSDEHISLVQLLQGALGPHDGAVVVSTPQGSVSSMHARSSLFVKRPSCAFSAWWRTWPSCRSRSHLMHFGCAINTEMM